MNSDLLACAKYRVDDIFTEISAGASSSLEADKHTYCHILFTVLIPRENCSSSFVGFLGGDWICYHIDDFSPEYDYCPVFFARDNTPLSLLFYNPDDDSVTSVRDSTFKFNHSKFLYKNITEALSILFPNSNFEGRSHDLNNVLYRLLMVSFPESGADDSPETNATFFKKTVVCIFQYLKQNEATHKDWIINVAFQPKELQKGGAFLKVLLRNLDKIVIKILAKIIAFTDRNYNLELIDPKNSVPLCVRNFWIAAFPKLVEYHLSSSAHNFEKEVYEYRSKFPFSKEMHCRIEGILNVQGLNIGKVLLCLHFIKMLYVNRLSKQYSKSFNANI